LANGTTSIAQIAERAGYSSLQSFTRTFKAAFGMPPAQYRAQGTHHRFRPTHPGDDQMVMREVVIRDIPVTEIVTVDHIGSYMQIGKAFDTLMVWLASRNLLSEQLRMVGVYYDDPGIVPEEKLRSKAGVVLLRSVEVTSPVSLTTIRAGQYAVLRHKGPYSDMRSAYDWLYGNWLMQSGREAADAPIFEEYLNNPKDTAPADLLTEICLPLV
jgi:AraC family transcriptional regulator